jgi:hypothetical protein
LEALRFNQGKGEHDYLLTYPSGVFLGFHPSCWLYDVQEAFGHWYQGRTDSVRPVIELFRDRAALLGFDVVSALAETHALGAKKYAVGNYLRGGNWRQYAQSEVRHALALASGEERDAEGNPHLGAIAFNLLMIDLCESWGLGRDDRVCRTEEAVESTQLELPAELPEPPPCCRPVEHDWRSDETGWQCQRCPAHITIVNDGAYRRDDLDKSFSTYWQAARGVV